MFNKSRTSLFLNWAYFVELNRHAHHSGDSVARPCQHSGGRLVINPVALEASAATGLNAVWVAISLFTLGQ